MSVDAAAFDVLGAGHEPDRRRRTVIAVLLVALLVVAAVAWLADNRSRRSEYTALSRCAGQAEDAFSESTQRISAMAEYIRPAVASASESTARGLYGMVSREATSVDDGLQRARAGCSAVDVARWHRAQRAARSARLVYLDAQLALLTQTAADGRAYFRDRSQLAGLRSAADSALAAARPGGP